MSGRDYWLSIAERSSPDDLREHILTGFKNGKPFTPYVPTISLAAPVGRVLDFGCGVGRSFPFLRTIAGHVTGFDLPPMIARCRTLASVPADDQRALRADRHDFRLADRLEVEARLLRIGLDRRIVLGNDDGRVRPERMT